MLRCEMRTKNSSGCRSKVEAERKAKELRGADSTYTRQAHHVYGEMEWDTIKEKVNEDWEEAVRKLMQDDPLNCLEMSLEEGKKYFATKRLAQQNKKVRELYENESPKTKAAVEERRAQQWKMTPEERRMQ